MGFFFFLLKGTTFGVSAGFTPGPLTMLTILQTLKYNLREGFKVAAAPLFTDLPILIVSIWTVRFLSAETHFPVIPFISICGSIFLAYLAYKSFFAPPLSIVENQEQPRSILKGIITNFLHPAPYLFWFTVGAPTVITAYAQQATFAIGFTLSFFLSFVLSKCLIAYLTLKSRRFLEGSAYQIVVRFFGLGLMYFSILFMADGLRGFGVI